MPVYFRSEIPERISIIFEAYANFIGRISSIASLTLRLLMSYIYMELLVKPEMHEISSLRVNIIKWQVKFNPVA